VLVILITFGDELHTKRQRGREQREERALPLSEIFNWFGRKSGESGNVEKLICKGW